jgi:hypothetical protein
VFGVRSEDTDDGLDLASICFRNTITFSAVHNEGMVVNSKLATLFLEDTSPPPEIGFVLERVKLY